MATLLDPVRLSTTVNIDLSSPFQLGVERIDGVLVYENMRILVKAQTVRKDNGIYTFDGAGYLVRATDFDVSDVIPCGTAVFIEQGDLLKNTGWVVNLYDDSAASSIIVGTDAILFARFSVNLNLASQDIPSALVLRSVKGYPLTITELDNNFKWISSTLNLKLDIVDFNPTTITDKINSLTADVASLDAWHLRGYAPTVISQPESIVVRDSNNDIYAHYFFGDLIGNANTATLADYATLANNVDGVVAVVNGGTGAATPADARVNLGAVNIAGDTMTGKLVLAKGVAGNASLTIPTADAAPAAPVQGDVWTTTSNIAYFLNGTTKTVAPNESPVFTGNPTAPTVTKTSNSTSLATTGFVQLHVTDLNAAIDLKAPIASPTLTGEPKSVTPATADFSTKIATTEFVLNKINSIIPNYYTKTQSDANLTGEANARIAGDANLQTQVDELMIMKGIPVGAVMHYAAAVTPIGWLKCNGALVSKLAYPQLFDKIGYTYGGAGNDFRLPDLRGEFLRGWDDGRGVDANRTLGSFQKATGVRILLDKYAQGLGAGSQYIDGTYAITGSNIDGFAGFETNHPDLMRYPGSGLVNVSSNERFQSDPTGRYVPGSGDNISFLTRPRNVAMMACIKAFGDIDNPDLINATAVLENINNKVDKRGDVMSGRLTLSADPTSALHAATKQYVDVVASNQYTITYGNEQYSTSGFSNTTRGFDETRNHFDVYPPAGKTMSNLAGFIPSIAYINFAGVVDNNDQLRCRWLNLGDRIRVQVQNTEQSAIGAANWIAFWR
jgi:hypothetical protein